MVSEIDDGVWAAFNAFGLPTLSIPTPSSLLISHSSYDFLIEKRY